VSESIQETSGWNSAKAREVYNITRWGNGYVEVSDHGTLLVRPDRSRPDTVDLHELAEELHRQGLALPVLVRFTDILCDRLAMLCGAFDRAVAEHEYQGPYTAVYPIKVNQQRSVVHQILAHGGNRVGLEAGSKPEMLAVMALSDAERGSVVVCNGYKDREYVRLALIGRRIGLDTYIVLEKLSEMDLVLAEAERIGVRPKLGLRVRLASVASGKWQNTGGEKGKFGLSTGQALEAVARLREAGMLDCLALMHTHMGSQISNVRDIQRGLQELTRYYVELRRLGAPIEVVDVGGGLAVDYEGSASRSTCSMNYSVQEYANNIVHSLWEACSQNDLPHPGIFTESGRAMTAHHAVLITDVVDYEPAPDPQSPSKPDDHSDPMIMHDLWEVFTRADTSSAVEAYHDAAYWLAEAQGLYVHGLLTLEQRAHAEQLYYATCRLVQPRLRASARAQRELLDELNDKLADKYFLNFSLFQSLPDSWAIDQIFPVVPLHRLDEAPTRRGLLQDLTCDSDGCVNAYIEGDGVEASLPLHPWRRGEPYVIGIFLVGAYQEILGDMHNLFGDTHSVNVALDGEGGYRLSEPLLGDTVANMLRYVHFEPEDMIKALRAKIVAAGLDAETRRTYLSELEAGLSGYTYLED
jgi:arginine decarboxylase